MRNVYENRGAGGGGEWRVEYQRADRHPYSFVPDVPHVWVKSRITVLDDTSYWPHRDGSWVVHNAAWTEENCPAWRASGMIREAMLAEQRLEELTRTAGLVPDCAPCIVADVLELKGNDDDAAWVRETFDPESLVPKGTPVVIPENSGISLAE